MAIAIYVNVHTFLVSSQLTCYLEDKYIGFSSFTLLPDNKETEQESNYHEASLSASKTTAVVLDPRYERKCVTSSISNWMNFHNVSRCHLLRQVNDQ